MTCKAVNVITTLCEYRVTGNAVEVTNSERCKSERGGRGREGEREKGRVRERERERGREGEREGERGGERGERERRGLATSTL